MMTTFLIHVDSKIYAKNRDKGGSYTGVFMTTQTTNHVAMTTHFLYLFMLAETERRCQFRPWQFTKGKYMQ